MKDPIATLLVEAPLTRRRISEAAAKGIPKPMKGQIGMAISVRAPLPGAAPSVAFITKEVVAALAGIAFEDEAAVRQIIAVAQQAPTVSVYIGFAEIEED